MAKVTNSAIMAAVDTVQRAVGEVAKTVGEVKTVVVQLHTTVTGNGGLGHEQRLGNIETWIKVRPLSCPATPAEMRKKVGWLVTVIAGVLTIVSVLANFGLSRLIVARVERDLRAQTTTIEGDVKPRAK